MNLKEMEIAIKNLQQDVKSLASRNLDEKKIIQNAKKIAQNAVSELYNNKAEQNIINSDLIEAITEIALLLGEEAAKHD